MMTPEHEALVRSTWVAAAPRAAAMVDRFYAELFERSPESRALFDRVDREALARKFQLTLGEIVAVLDDPERLGAVRGEDELLRRHAPEHEGHDEPECADERGDDGEAPGHLC